MRLVYESEVFIPIVRRLKKEEVNEDGTELDFEVRSSFSILMKKDLQRIVYLNNNLPNCYKNVKGFTLDKANPGFVFISNKGHLKKHDLINRLLADHSIKPSNILFLGQHVLSKAEKDFIIGNKLHYFSMKEISMEGAYEVSESIMNICRNFSDVYILIDSEVLDYTVVKSSWAGGLTVRELLFFIHRLKRMDNLRTFELVIHPLLARVAVKLLAEMYVPENH